MISSSGEAMSDPRALPWGNRRSDHPVHDPPRVLVAEDDSDMRALVADALSSAGCRVETLSDGGRLLVEIAHEIPGNLEGVDLIVSDIRMPVASGLQILEALRAAHVWTPVILMTAFGDEATHAHAERLGALLLDKPFEMPDLLTAVVNVLDIARDARAAFRSARPS
jgi:DNA-binding response OmpR family regulator